MGDRFRVEGVPDEGIRVSDIKDEVPESLICQYFGPKSSKSGWKYNARTTVEEQEAIYSLFRRVYETDEMSNKELTLQFARGLVYMSMGNKVDWCQFRDERRKYRVELWKKKDINCKEKSERVIGEGAPCPATIEKRRCIARVSEVVTSFPCELKLSVKSECQDLGVAVLGGKVRGKSPRGALNSALWMRSDLEVMEKVIQERSELVRNCELSLSESTLQSGDLEDKLRRAIMLRSDRLEMIQETELEYRKIQSEELAVKVQVEEKTLLSRHDLELSSKTLIDKLLVNLVTELEALEFRRVCAQATRKRSDKVVSDCNESIAILESKLAICRTTNEELSHRVSSLKGLLASMDGQLRVMEEGGGNLFFPLPITGSPTIPLTLIHTLNACLVCCLWFSYWDYVPASCGHCYHPWCLAEHMKSSCKCLLSSCEKPFLAQHKIALGIHPTTAAMIVVVSKEAEIKNIKNFVGADVVGVVLKSALKTTAEKAMIEKDVQKAQSTETNSNAMKGLASTIKNLAKVQLCFQCNVKKCGHALFCFGCVNGKSECPFCFEKIVGWEPLPVDKQSTMQTLLPTAALIPAMVHGNKKRMIEESKDLIEEVPPIVFDTPAEGFSDSDEEKETALRFWCDDEVFNAGGVQSIELKSKEETVHEHADVTIHKEVARESESNKETIEGPVVESSCVKVFPRKRTERKSTNSLNHTRVMEKALIELLGPSSKVGAMEKTLKKVQVEASTPTATRGYGRSRGGSKISMTQEKLNLFATNIHIHPFFRYFPPNGTLSWYLRTT